MSSELTGESSPQSGVLFSVGRFYEVWTAVSLLFASEQKQCCSLSCNTPSFRAVQHSAPSVCKVAQGAEQDWAI